MTGRDVQEGTSPHLFLRACFVEAGNKEMKTMDKEPVKLNLPFGIRVHGS